MSSFHRPIQRRRVIRSSYMSSPPHSSSRSFRHAGPPPGIVASVFTVLFLAGLVPVTLIMSDTHFPAPFQPPSEIVAYFRENAARVTLCAFFQFGSAIPLGIYVATMTSRLRFLGVRAAGVDLA